MEQSNKTSGNKKVKHQFSKMIIGSIILANIIFTTAALIVFAKTGSEPGVLIGAWFAWTTGECWALAGIKKSEQNGESE